MATAKDILTLTKSKSILQRIGAMWSSIYCGKSKDKLGLFNHYHGFGSIELVDKILKRSYNIINKNSKIAVMNDFGLEVISRLIDEGFTNVCILCTEENDDLYSLIKFMVKREFNFDKIVRLETNMSDKFDLVIANPPYEIGNEIIAETMKHCNNAVVLMPIRSYRVKNLYKYINNIELVDPKFFDGSGAYVPHGLSICDLKQDSCIFSTWSEVEINYFDSNYRLVYEWNEQHADKRQFKEDGNVGYTSYENNPFDPDTDFLASSKIVSPYNGVYFGGFDYAWNVTRREDILKKWCALICVIHFQTKTQKDNFTKWWYSNTENNGLTTKLLWGLNKTTCPLLPAIPVIDWSRTDVEYTDEYVLSQMGLRWNKTRDGAEKL